MKINKSFGQRILKLCIVIAVMLLIASSAYAVPNTMTLQGRLLNSTGAILSGVYNMSFRVYDSYTNGNILWSLNNTNVTADSRGVYDIMLKNVNLGFADQYYLGITVGTDSEGLPRINLSSSPYAFRANVSETLNENNMYTVSILNITGNLSIGTSGDDVMTITAINFNLTSAGNLNVAGNTIIGGDLTLIGALGLYAKIVNATERLTANNTLYVLNSKVGIGKSPPNFMLDVAGTINASDLNISGGITLGGEYRATWPVDSSATGWNFANNESNVLDNNTIIRTGNITSWDLSSADDMAYTNITTKWSNIDLNTADDFSFANNLTSLLDNNTIIRTGNITYWDMSVTDDFRLENYSSEYASTGFRKENQTASSGTSPWNSSGTFAYLNDSAGLVGIGTAVPTAKLTINDSSLGGALLITNVSGSPLLFVNGSNGKVGIRTTSPRYALDVNGEVIVQTGSNNYGEIYTPGSGDLYLGNLNEGTINIGGDGTNSRIRADYNNLVFEWDRPDDSGIHYITFQGTNLGGTQVYFEAGDFGTSAYTQFIVPAYFNGNVGIGTTSPLALLHINNTAVGNALLISDDTTASVAFSVNASSGRAGVGNVSVPNSTLTIAGNITPSLNNTFTLGEEDLVWKDLYLGPSSLRIGGIALSNLNGNLQWNGEDIRGNVITGSNINSTNLNVSGTAVLMGRVGIGQLSPNLTLGVSGDANITGFLEVGKGLNVTNGMNVITGNVGIGTTAPSSKLEVAGNITVAATNNTLGNFSIIQYNATCAGFRFGSTGAVILSCS